MVYNHKDHQAGPLMPWAVPWRSMRTTPWTAARDCLVTHPVTMAPEALEALRVDNWLDVRLVVAHQIVVQLDA